MGQFQQAAPCRQFLAGFSECKRGLARLSHFDTFLSCSLEAPKAKACPSVQFEPAGPFEPFFLESFFWLGGKEVA